MQSSAFQCFAINGHCFPGYLVGESGKASAASVTIRFGTHPVSPVNVRQTGSTVTTVSIAWDSPENEPSGKNFFIKRLKKFDESNH